MKNKEGHPPGVLLCHKVFLNFAYTLGAECEVRTRDLRLGKPTLYQLS